ncbi:MAG: hypothetical protein RLZZ493_695 [Bacteroidota bacterium]|jgi:hypothetical protein
MNNYRFLAVSFITTALLSSCVTSEKWIEDDVYSLKEASLPINTDVNEDTDYNAYVFQKHNSDNKIIYANNTNQQDFNLFDGFNRMNLLRFGLCINNYNRLNQFNSPFLGANGQVYYSLYSSNAFGNGIFFNNGYGFVNLNNNWGSTSDWASNNTNNNGNYAFTNTTLNGPRGSISGMGGITSRSKNTLKSSTIGNPVTVGKVRSNNMPVAAIPRPAKMPSIPVSAGRVANGGNVSFPTVGGVIRTASRTATTVTTSPRVGNGGGISVGRTSGGGGVISGGVKTVGRH